MSKKTRKVFAIFTILAMLMAFVPGTVFAAADYSAAASSIYDADDDAKADDVDEAEIEVRFRGLGGSLIAGEEIANVYVESSRDAEAISVVHWVYDEVRVTVTPNDNNTKWEFSKLVTDSKGIVTFVVTSGVPGDAEISFYKDDGHDLLIGKTTITFKDVDVDEVLLEEDQSVEAGKSFTLTATALAAGFEVEGLEITFQEEDNGDWDDVGKAETDKDGEAELKLTYTKTGTYTFRAKYDDVNSGTVDVTVTPGPSDSIVADKDVMFVDVADDDFEVKFTVEDVYGNAITDTDKVEVEVTDPDGDDYDDFGVDVDADDNIVVTVDIDEEGDYLVVARLTGTTISAETTVTVAEFGDIVAIELELDDEILLSDESTQAVVTLIDELGIEKEYDTDDEEIIFSSSDASIATVTKYGGAVTARDTGVVTITAYHVAGGLEDSVELVVSGEPAFLDVGVEVDDLEAEVTLTLLDEDGLKAFEDGDDGYRVIVPAGVEVEDQKDFKNGVATFTLVAEELGTYTIRVVTDLGISAAFPVAFLPPFDMGAEQVIMYIGSTTILVDDEAQEIDVAPFIEEDRTFVPVRFLAEAFAAEADWGPKDGLTEWVTLTREDVTIMINIGEDQMTVTRNGDVEVVELDAPARIVDDRTFLPFRAIGEAFGAEVDYETDEETGLTTSVWFTQ